MPLATAASPAEEPARVTTAPPASASSLELGAKPVTDSAPTRTTLGRGARELAVAYSSILFLNKPVLGVALLLATFLQPDIAVCGLMGLASGASLLRMLSIKTATFRASVLYNTLLTGLFVGYVFQLDGRVALLTFAAAALCLVLAAALDSVLHFYELPVLSLPFTFTALILALARPHFSNLGDSSFYHVAHPLPVPELVNGALKSLAAIFCTPDPLFGAVMLVLLALASPLTALFFVTGFLLGHELESFLRLGQDNGHILHQFNYSLTFAAVSLVFLQPSRKSILLGLLTVVLTTLISLGSATYWEMFRIPMVPFAFNVTVLIVLRAAKWLLPGELRAAYAGSPEATLDQARLFRLRQRSGEIGIFCPFTGDWTVQQGFEGPWTHKGNWRHALDFVKQGPDGKTFLNRGLELNDYHCFAKTIHSPVEGVVTATCTDQADNPIGTVDNQNNWGNYILIRSSAGFYVLLAHLKKNSVTVKVGDAVQVGRALGQCGNSGYSQEPHLHLQVQWYGLLGGHTSPFHLINYREETQFVFRGLPRTGAVVSPFPMNVALDRSLSFRIGEKLSFKKNGDDANPIELRVELDEVYGTLYFTDGASRLSFGKLGASFFFYGFKGSAQSMLSDLYRAAPRVPMTFGEAGWFCDEFPIRFGASRFGPLGRGFTVVKELLRVGDQGLSYRFEINPQTLEFRGNTTLLKLDPIQGIRYFEAKGKKYERVA